ncbi:MAG TPA: SRPBCC domain-containing protein [Candidatus Saccharimonadales bacterium]|nr:SRPBCC domain-containing protein [Candidatus Saccharimonadales bacterium]
MNETKIPKFERVLPAPRDKVWQAWTDPEIIKKWWGPAGFSAPVAEIDLRVGGKYLYCMRGSISPGQPQQDFYSGGEFLEIVPLEKIALTDYFTDKDGSFVKPSAYGMGEMPEKMHVTITFEDAGENQTKLTIRYAEEIPDEHRAGMIQGWDETLDKFGKALGEV